MLPLVIALALGAQPIKLAAPGLTSVNVDAKTADFYSGQLAQQLGLQPNFQVLTPAEISAVVGLERQKELLGCEASSCTAELAGALGVDAIVLGSVAKVGSSYTLNVKIVSATNAQPLSVVSQRAPTEDALIELINSSAKTMAEQVTVALRGPLPPPVGVAAESGGPPLRLVIPAAVGVVLLGSGAAFYALARGQASLLENPDSISTRGAYLSAMSTGSMEQVLAFTLGGVGIAAIVTGVVLYFVGAPAKVAVAVDPRTGTVALGGTF